jgi:hypothetical protein
MTCLEIVRYEPFTGWRRLLIARSGIGAQSFGATAHRSSRMLEL